MTLPIVANCYQATLVWGCSLAPRPATTTLHFYDAIGSQTAANLFTDLNASVTASMWSMLSLSAAVDTVNVTKLDGSSAGQSFATGRPAKWAGTSGSEIILQGAVVVSLKSAQRGPRGRNRVYLPWVAESSQTNGTLDASLVTSVGTAWATFLGTMAAADWNLTAVSGVHSDRHDVVSLAVRPYVKTQRRRARR